MKKSSVAVVSVLATACMVALAADPSSDGIRWLEPSDPVAAPADGEPVDESPQRWFVELSGAPAADGGRLTDLRAEKQAFRNAARAAKLQYLEHYAYDSLFNGFSVSVTRAQIATLTRLPGVKAIYPVETVAMPRPDEASADMASALAMTGADVAQNALGLDGRGIRVAVMDTGIDIDHPDFGGAGSNGATSFPTARIVAGYDFVGDAFNADSTSPAYNPVPVPDNNPDDCGGHGTHVAGIIGASGAVRGVAPGVTFGAYRVFGCGGSTTADVMVAAMERALADDMDVLNMSIGSTYQWPEYPTAKAATRLVNKGVVVVASAGNSGATGLYSTGAPSVGDKVISVASFDNTMVSSPAFTIQPGNRAIGYNAATGAPAPPATGTAQLGRTSTPAAVDDGCSAASFAGFPAGQYALIRRGSCSFHIKAANAQAAGAAGVVLYNNAPGGLNPTVVGPVPITIPVVGISQADGDGINVQLGSSAVQMTWGATASVPNPTGGRLSSFTSYGMSPDLQLKPDIGAPGGAIYSTYPLESGRYASLSGTSMAAPHVAGAAALLLQAAPRTPSQAVGRILQNTAVPKNWSGNPALGLLDIVHRQGAGMLRIDEAITTATRVEPGKLSLGESEAGPATRTLMLRNTGPTKVTYTLSATNAVSTGANTFVPTFFLPSTGVAFSAPSVTLAPGGTATVGVTITPPAAAPAGGLYGGYVVMTPDDGSAALRVPFAGYAGDYQARTVLAPTPSGFPWLARLQGAGYVKEAAGAAYSMVGNDIPFFLVHFDHQARLVRMDVVDAATGKAWHRAYQTEHFGRNSSATGFFSIGWDGTTTAGGKTYTVPNGRYIVKLSVLKALGDASNPAHWERWDSPEIRIAR